MWNWIASLPRTLSSLVGIKAAPNYYKATLDNGESSSHPAIFYRAGKVVHPNPDRESKSSCGVGIHLAKSIKAAQKYVPKATEIYLAKPCTILGEDSEKVRCDSCRIIKRLSGSDVERLAKEELTAEERRRKEWKAYFEV